MGDDALSAGTVARRLGVAVTTLRTWHQRYGLGPSRHVPGQHRRYTHRDIARLEVMRRLTAEGVPPAEAARWALRATPQGASESTAGSRTSPPGGERGRPCTLPDGRGGRSALSRAALRLDSPAMSEIITQTIAAQGVINAWESVLCPVLADIGERHAVTTELIEVEHLLSRCVSEGLAAVPRPPVATGPPRVLLACADEEQHSLPLEALAAALAQVGVACRMFGARVPTAALAEAVVRTRPMAVVLWSHDRCTADPAQWQAITHRGQRPSLLLAAGPGWHPESLPPGVYQPLSLSEAVGLLLRTHDAPRAAG